ncbi:MAG: AI-2E family transporter [Clostridia bacterium]|nr:AI-2E family transporter [Clostridia bacterium]
MKKEKDWKRWIGFFTFCVMLIIIYKTLDNFSDIFKWIGNFSNIIMPFILAVIIAYVFYIPCKKIEDIYGKSKLKFIAKKRRGLSTLTIYILAAIFIFFVIRFVFPTLATSISELATNLPGYYNRAIEYFSNLPEDSTLKRLNIADMVLKIQEIDITDKIVEFLNFDNISQYIKGVMDFTGIIFDAFVTIVVSIYLILERGDIKSFLSHLSKAVFSKEFNEKISVYYKKTNTIFFSFISSQVIDAILIGLIASIAMSILNVKYAILLGFLIGIFNIIPYFGAIVGVVIAIIITIFTGGIIKAIWMAITVIILQQIDANIINPRILGNSLHLSPILVIFSVTLLGSYFGILGMFLAVPIAAMIKILLLDFIKEKENNLEI